MGREAHPPVARQFVDNQATARVTVAVGMPIECVNKCAYLLACRCLVATQQPDPFVMVPGLDDGSRLPGRRRQSIVAGWSVRYEGRESYTNYFNEYFYNFDLTDPARVFTKEELMRDVWGYRSTVYSRTLDAHASRLRRKLRAEAPELELVDNVWGVGYRLLGPLPG